MNKNFEIRKEELICEILKSWREEPIQDEGDEKIKQYLRASTPTLRVFITINIFEERAKHFSGIEDAEKILTAIEKCKKVLEKQYELGELFISNGFCFKTSEKVIEYSSNSLRESLEKAVSDDHVKYSQKSSEELKEEVSIFIQGIEMLGELYN